ncbi:MAG: bifunctional hydroxymethylpyrimidine kinase/phosphomethylpyrimidine kinase [Deltaproteobacteria bacterium]|nr:MAG: bifunctional hydroxymethylpyrimidine kinase/phosphomethylpyrimidine kinase [Deltaproteobacteria bacterium]
MNYTRPIVLTIAGSDSGGGAGIQADLKTITVHGCFGVSVLTALTAQNTVGVQGIFPVPIDFIRKQADSIFDDFTVAAAKTGMLHSEEVIRLVAETLSAHPGISYVCDPVMVAKSGDKLLMDDAIHALKSELLPLATVVTPNIPEAEVLWGNPIKSKKDKEAACRAIHGMGARAVLLKGGHETGTMSTDLLFDGERFHQFSSPRYETQNTHGTGCTTSAAIASNLARGMDVITAIAEAKKFMDTAIRFSLNLGNGHGPTDHFAATEREKERYQVLHGLQKAVEYFSSHPAGHLIPEVQTNIAYALPFAATHGEVAAIPGRIVSLNGHPHASGCPAFGASRHVANIVLTVMRFSPAHRSVMNIRYDKALLAKAESLGLVIRSFNRKDEPADVKEQEGSTLEWGTREVLSGAEMIPDIIFDTGDVGKEPMIRVIGADPMEVVIKALRMGGIQPN